MIDDKIGDLLVEYKITQYSSDDQQMKFKAKTITAIKAVLLEALPNRRWGVTTKAYFANGWNAYHDEITAILKGEK